VPENYAWPCLLARDGDYLEVDYRHVLESLGKEPGMLGVIFRLLEEFELIAADLGPEEALTT